MAGFGVTLLAIILTAAMIFYILFEVRKTATGVVLEDQPALIKALELSAMVKESISKMGLFTISKEAILRHNSISELEISILKVNELKKLRVISSNTKLSKLVRQIDKDVKAVQGYHSKVMFYSSDFTLNLPGVAHSSKYINKINIKILSNIEKMTSEERSNPSPRLELLYLLSDLQYNWVKVVSGLRVYLGFRAANGLQEINVFFEQFKKTQVQIRQQYGQDFLFVQEEIFPRIPKLSQEFVKHFKIVKSMQSGPKWRMDAWILREKLMPLIERLDSNTEAISILLQKRMNVTSMILLADAKATSGIILGMIILIIGVVLMLAWLLLKGIINPMADAIDNGLSRFKDLIRQISHDDASIFDRQYISSDDTLNLNITFDLMGHAMEAAITRQMESASELSERVQNMMIQLQKVSAGDLTIKVNSTEGGEGEKTIDKLASCIQGMLDNICSLVIHIQSAGKDLTTSTEAMAMASCKQESTIVEQAKSSDHVMSAVTLISETSRNLVTTVDEVHEVAENTAEAASQGHIRINKMAQTMNQMFIATAAISEKLSVLNEKAGKISTVVTTINKVADQTNLLSLNAAIEAEQAGDAGRGFAVVAREIRRLADQTAVATWDIEQMVDDVQLAVSDGVSGMVCFSKEVEKGVSEVSKVGSELANIIAQVHLLTPKFENVSNGMKSQSEAADQINDNMEQLNTMLQDTARSIKISNSEIKDLTQSAQTLSKSAARFKIK